MAFNATVYRIFIASPSDVEKERKEICQIIYDWNITNGNQNGVILEPVRYQSHSIPEMGDRAQALINKQLLDESDLLIGIFWTRLGTPTGDFESGSQEEVEKFRIEKKPVMLYFSDAPIPPSMLEKNRSQYKKLMEYKKTCEQNAIIHPYKRVSDLKKLFSAHLNLAISKYFPKTISTNKDTIKTNFLWNGSDIDEFILKEKELLIFLKDGYTIFSKKYNLLLRRFQDPTLLSKVMILHPDYEYMGAVAGMDPFKIGNPNIQKGDCMKAISAMHQMRKQIKIEKAEDISKRIVFGGYRAVPTWNGYIGDSKAIIHLYPTVAFRGNLPSLEIVANNNTGGQTDWYRIYKNEWEQIERDLEKQPGSNLWKYNLQSSH
jgi:hypothetical protein